MSKLVESINPSNTALKYIDHRLKDDQYRGRLSSQHNRYNKDDIIKLLTILNRYIPDKKLMVIRTTDIKKRPNNTEEEKVYAEFCNEVKRTTGIGTQDAMRKNLFVDLHRMELIKRYNSNQESIPPFAKGNIKYVSLSDQGIKLITENDPVNQYYLFTKAVDKLLEGYINILLNLLMNEDHNLKRIDFYELMYFVSAVGTGTSSSIKTKDCVELIKEYRNNSRVQKQSVHEMLKNKLKPENYLGDKKDKRDFHNWQNKIQQIWVILKQTVYFEIIDSSLYLKNIEFSRPNANKQKSSRRSASEKLKYFDIHKVKKRSGFELHHVIPLAWSESPYQFKLFDNWMNMIYIDAYSHAKITQNRSKNVVMSADEKDLWLSDYEKNTVHLKKDINLLYSTTNQKQMLDYNHKLLKSDS